MRHSTHHIHVQSLRRVRILWGLFFIVGPLGFSVLFFASDSAASEAAVTQPEAHVATLADGDAMVAELEAVTEDWKLRFATEAGPRELDAAELVAWGVCPEPRGGAVLLLSDGGLLSAEPVSSDGVTLVAQSELFGRVTLPMERIAGIVVSWPDRAPDADDLLQAIQRHGEPHDLIALGNRDRIAGTVIQLQDGVWNARTSWGDAGVPLARLRHIRFNPLLLDRSGPDGPHAVVAFSEGTRLTVERLIFEGDRLVVHLVGDVRLTTTSRPCYLAPRGGRALYLSDLEPIEQVHIPYLTLPWPFREDRNVRGGLLRAGGRLHLKGLGMHSAARVAYALPPGVVAFEAEVAIDDSAEGQGSADFHVYVDGQRRASVAPVRGGRAPQPLRVELEGAERLDLVVDYGERAAVLDYADWLGARLIRQ